jgi:CheY-like chemotaxis protein/HPt (histidine-containing phosphotransfer) domain-containing protein
MMGGSIEMASEPGKGTSVALTVPLPVADVNDLPKSESEGPLDLPGSATGMRRAAPTVAQAEAEGTLVLLVDDHPTNRALLIRQVHALGYAAECAEDGVEALKLWKTGRFGIVITDCNMPEMDGYELTRSIRKLESGKGGERSPILACTANALRGEAETCFAAGMDDILVKPVDLKSLLKKLNQWLPMPATAAADAATPLDGSGLAALSGGDAAAEREILMDFRRANDDDAMLLKQAVAQGNIPEVARAAHRIKGASGMVGANPLVDICDRIEQASRRNDVTAIERNMQVFQLEWTRLNAFFDSLPVRREKTTGEQAECRSST